MTTKQARWKCPQCNAGILAQTKPRKDDVRRYCYPCSIKSGRLVERIACALAPDDEPSKLQERCDTIRERIIRKEAERIWKLMAEWHKGKPLPRINIVRGRNWGSQHGYARPSWGLIQVNVDARQDELRSKRVWQVLAHELAHIACPPINTGGKYRNTHHRIFYYCLRHAWQKRWKCEISFGAVTHWGYSVDYIIQGQASKHITFTLPNPVTPPTQDVINNNTEGNKQ